VLTLYQAEWCPYSHRVRERLTELGVDFVARQVPADKERRHDLVHATGQPEIPALVTDSDDVIAEWRQIIAWLDAHYTERPDAELHRAKLVADADARDPRSPLYPR
jgi:glutathione S-transferase